MRIRLTGHVVSGFSSQGTGKEELLAQGKRADIMVLTEVSTVHPDWYDSAGLVVSNGSRRIGWVPKGEYLTTLDQLKSIYGPVPLALAVRAVDTWTIPGTNGRKGLIVESLEPIKTQAQPEIGATPMAKLPTVKDLIDANIAGVSTAAQLETGRVANQQLAKIIAARVPKQYAPLLATPFGHLALANAISVGAKALYPDNALLKKVSNAMIVDSYQELLRLVDIPGIVDELLANKQVLGAVAKDQANEG